MNNQLSTDKVLFSIIITTSILLVVISYVGTRIYRVQAEQAKVTAEAIPTMTAEALEFHYQKGIGNINIGRWYDAEAELAFVFEVDPNYKDVQAKLAEVYAVIEAPTVANVTGRSTVTPGSVLNPINLQAADYDNGVNIWVDDGLEIPCRRGLLYNAWPFTDRPNSVNYTFEAVAGDYDLEIAYASMDERAVEIKLNRQLISRAALKTMTGGWCNENVKWVQVGRVKLQNGTNLLEISRSSVFPHFKAIRFIPVN